jgi:hypothetical protein
MPNMVVDFEDDLLIGVHNASTPTDEEWGIYLDVCVDMLARERTAGGKGKGRQLIITDGGGPNLEQRRLAQRVAGDARLPVAVISTSRLVRFIVTALVVTRTNSLVRAFAPDQTHDAYEYLRIADRETVERRIAALRIRLDARVRRRKERRPAKERAR